MWSQLALLLCADNLAMVELAKKVHSMRSELYRIKSDNSDDVTKAAELLGNGMKNEGATQRCPLDIEDNEGTIPESWSNSCQAILMEISLTQVHCKKWLATSFGIDLLCAISHGRVKPPCHHFLIFIVKSLMGGTELVHTPNRLGDNVHSLYSASVDRHSTVSPLDY